VSRSESQDDIVARILSGTAPPAIRSAAARGALPLPRSSLVRLYLHLLQDEDEAIRTDARASLGGLEKAAVHEVLQDEECPPEVLEHFSQQAARDEALAERIAFHRSVPNGALAKLAAAGTAAVIELVLTNQERLLVQPELLDLLSVNPALRADQRGRILELLERAMRVTASAEGHAGAPSGTEGISAEFEEAARLLQVDVGELFAASEILDGEELANAADPEIRTAYRRILTLNTAQKAILAMRGGREERLILIRDTNKLVSQGVLRNPRVTDEDVETFARMRSVTGEVLRQIGQSRDWSRSYGVISALINNPRTPQSISTNFVSRLHNQDLRRLQGNHDVPELIRRMAKRTLEMRTQKTSGVRKKKH
jgi:hypothetical protein